MVPAFTWQLRFTVYPATVTSLRGMMRLPGVPITSTEQMRVSNHSFFSARRYS